MPLRAKKAFANVTPKVAELAARGALKIMHANSNIEFVRRILEPEGNPVLRNKDGSISTHLLSAEIDEDGRTFVFPNIVKMPDGKLKRFENAFDALRYNRETNNVIEFKSIQEALEFTKNYKTPAFKSWGDSMRRKNKE